MTDLKDISKALQRGDAPRVKELTEAALTEDIEPGAILNEGLIAGMNIIGTKFKNNEVYIPEVLVAARAMHQGMDVLKPNLVKNGIEPVGKIVLGTVKGDLHDIGKNLVGMMMEGAGFEVVDLGIDVPAEKFLKAIKDTNAPLMGISALLTTTMEAMKDVMDELEKKGYRQKVKVMIGGAPVTQRYADEIKADAFAPDAASAAEKAKELIGK